MTDKNNETQQQAQLDQTAKSEEALLEELTTHTNLDDEGEIFSLGQKIEALIFASPKPMKASEIQSILEDGDISAKEIIDEVNKLQEYHNERSGGFYLEHINGVGYQFRTHTEASYLMERMFSQRPRPLSRAAQETLAIIAYRQPVTRADIEFIRGVDAGSIIKNLLERELIACVGRKEDSGRPMIFGTTSEFLKVYNLNTLNELPPLESFQPARDRMKNALDKIGVDTKVDVEEMIKNKDEPGLTPTPPEI